MDGAGIVYFGSVDYNIVLRLDGDGQLTRVAGAGTQGYSGDNGPATSAQMDWALGLTIDAAGNLYILDAWNNGNARVRKVSNGVITTVAGQRGYSGDTSDNIPATSADLGISKDVAVDAAGNLYIAEHYCNLIARCRTA